MKPKTVFTKYNNIDKIPAREIKNIRKGSNY